MWTICPYSNKPEVCAANLWKLRAIYGSAALAAGYACSYVVPLVGFDVGGIVPNSIAAAWQAKIGNVAAGSIFAGLTSLGMTGYGALMFGTTSGGLALLTGLVTENKLDWCTCQSEPFQKYAELWWEKVYFFFEWFEDTLT